MALWDCDIGAKSWEEGGNVEKLQAEGLASTKAQSGKVPDFLLEDQSAGPPG